MTELRFKAPALFDSTATPGDSLRGALHDAPAMAEHLAKIKRFVIWLKTEMDKKELASTGPFVDESGWIIEAPSKGGFVVCIVTGPDKDSTDFHILVSEFSGATREVGDTVEAILRNSGEISELRVGQ